MNTRRHRDRLREQIEQLRKKTAGKDFQEPIIEEHSFAVYLSNRGSDRKHHSVLATERNARTYVKDWTGIFVPPGSSLEEGFIPEHTWPIELIVRWSKNSGSEAVSDSFADEMVEKFAGTVPDADHLQFAYEHVTDSTLLLPSAIVSTIKGSVDRHFPKERYHEVLTPSVAFRNFEGKVPIRVAASLVGVAYACEEANRGDLWFRRAFGLGEPKLGGCLMTHGVYLYRRHTKATYGQISTVMRTWFRWKPPEAGLLRSS